MDPNEALRQLRVLVIELGSELDAEHSADQASDLSPLASEMVDTFDGLDQWLTAGGFLPDEWQHDSVTRDSQAGPGAWSR